MKNVNDRNHSAKIRHETTSKQSLKRGLSDQVLSLRQKTSEGKSLIENSGHN